MKIKRPAIERARDIAFTACVLIGTAIMTHALLTENAPFLRTVGALTVSIAAMVIIIKAFFYGARR